MARQLVTSGGGLHIRAGLLLGFGELVRRSNAPCLIEQGLPFRLHLLNERIQLLLALLPGLGIDILRMPFPVWPHREVTPLEQVVIDLGDIPGA